MLVYNLPRVLYGKQYTFRVHSAIEFVPRAQPWTLLTHQEPESALAVCSIVQKKSETCNYTRIQYPQWEGSMICLSIFCDVSKVAIIHGKI
jgi:hypothetical protein